MIILSLIDGNSTSGGNSSSDGYITSDGNSASDGNRLKYFLQLVE